MNQPEQRIHDWIAGRGRATRGELVEQFDRMPKSKLDEALIALTASGAVLRGVKDGQVVFAPAKRAAAPPPDSRLLRDRVAEAVSALTDCFTAPGVAEAISWHRVGSVRGVLDAMVRDGMLVRDAPGRYRNPTKPGIDIDAVHRNNPSEARRETAAVVTSEMPEAAAAPIPAGDAPDESAATESPAAVMGPPPAEQFSAEQIRAMEAANEPPLSLVNEAMRDAVERITPAEEPDMNAAEEQELADLAREHIADVTQIRDEPMGPVQTGDPMATFTLCNDHVRITIEGDPASVLRTVSAIDQAMMS